MSYNEKCDLYLDDPVTLSRYFDFKLSKIIEFMKDKNGPFGDKFYKFYSRIEYQHRGAPHSHMLLWLEGSPQFSRYKPSTIPPCEEFIDE